jgi:dTDP-4-dehydrorhamnose reductase
VDRAETERELAMQVNAGATANIAAGCAAQSAGLTYLSTDYVFPGTAPGYDEDAPRDPVNHYGLSKARGEEAVASRVPRWQILRTSWLFGPGPRNFVLTIRRLLSERQELQVVDDQIGCPTYAPDLAELLVWLVNTGQSGYYHGTNRGNCTWFTFAREIARLSGADPERIAPCTSREFPTPARRPACSILRSRNLERLGYPARPTWQDALARYVRLLADDSQGS